MPGLREPEFLNTYVADLMEAITPGDVEDEGVQPTTFVASKNVDIVLFGRNTVRLALMLNARRPMMLLQTAEEAENITTVTGSRTPNSAGKFTVNTNTVFGFPFTFITAAGPISMTAISIAKPAQQSSRSACARYDSVANTYFYPIVLKATDFDGRTEFAVGNKSYEVIGVWDQHAEGP